MLLIDVLIAIGVVGLAITGVAGISAIRRKAKPEIKGAENAEEVIAQSKRRCHFCRKDTDSNFDVYAQGNWYHKVCFLNRSDNKDK